MLLVQLAANQSLTTYVVNSFKSTRASVLRFELVQLCHKLMSLTTAPVITLIMRLSTTVSFSIAVKIITALFIAYAMIEQDALKGSRTKLFN